MSDPRVTDEMVEAAQAAWTKAYWTERTPGKLDWMRAALEAVVGDWECLCNVEPGTAIFISSQCPHHGINS
jgi:hypothetical protein